MNEQNNTDKTGKDLCEIHAELMNKCRDEYFRILWEKVKAVEVQFIQECGALSDTPENKLIQAAMRHTLSEMLSVNALLSALRYGGPAKSIMLLNSYGQAIDLLSAKELTENEMFNQILDNHADKNKKH